MYRCIVIGCIILLYVMAGNTKICAAENYSIQYELNGGYNDPANPAYYTKDDDEIVLKDAGKNGYAFLGWYQDKEMKERVDTINPMEGHNWKLYAKYKLIHYNITFQLSGGAMDNLYNYVYTIESENLTLPIPQKNGYVFEGWYENALFAGNPISVISKGSFGQKTLYAKWSLQQYSISYYPLEGELKSANPASYNVLSGTIVLPSPTRSGYTFSGWYEDLKYTTKITKITAGSTGNRLAFAKWKKVSVGKVGKVKLKQAGNYLNISYPKVSNAKGYEITYYKKGKKNLAKTVSLKQLSYTLLKCKTGTTYCVKVRAYAYDSANQRVYGKYSKVYKYKMS